MNKIVQCDPPKIKTEYSFFLKDLVFDLLSKDPEKRLKIQTLINRKEIQLEISKLKEKWVFEEKPSKLSFQEFLKKLETEETTINCQNKNNNPLQSDKTLTKKAKTPSTKLANFESIEHHEKCSQKPPRHFHEILISKNLNNAAIGQEKKSLKTRSQSLNNNISDGASDNINMETIIKNKDFSLKTITNSSTNKEETINNFANFIKKEQETKTLHINLNLNNQTQNIHQNEKNSKKHVRRCSINTRNENQQAFYNKNSSNNFENKEYLKKVSLDFLKKIFDVNAPLAPKRKLLLKEFLNKKLGFKICEDVQKLINKYEDNREVLGSKILEVIGKENESYILIFNYLFNAECFQFIKN